MDTAELKRKWGWIFGGSVVLNLLGVGLLIFDLHYSMDTYSRAWPGVWFWLSVFALNGMVIHGISLYRTIKLLNVDRRRQAAKTILYLLVLVFNLSCGIVFGVAMVKLGLRWFMSIIMW